MTPHDRWLEPDDDYECETCGGDQVVLGRKPWVCPDEWVNIPCPDCQHDSDLGEPNEEPDL